MPTKFKIATGLVALLAIYDLSMYPLLQTKYSRLEAQHQALQQEYIGLCEQMSYLIHLMNEHDVVLDEFDLIVLRNAKVKQA